MNGYNRCGGYKAPMMYAMPTMQQPMPVKTEMVNVPEACETKVMAPQVAPMQPAYPMPAPVCGPMKVAAKSLSLLYVVCQKYTIIIE